MEALQTFMILAFIIGLAIGLAYALVFFYDNSDWF